MLNFSMPTVFMAVFFSNLLIVLIYLILRSLKFTLHTGSKLLLFFLGVIFLRLLFPFELPHCIQVYIPNDISKYITWMRWALFPNSNSTFCVWDILLIIWICGSLIRAHSLLRSYYFFQKTIRVLGQEKTSYKPFSSLMNNICLEQHIKNTFQVILMPNLGSPMICGLRKPVILLPDTLSVSKQDLYYILYHEVFHYTHHDLWIKLGTELLTVLYWWNPIVYLFQKQISNLLEVQIDEKVVTMPQAASPLDYIQCLMRVAQSGYQSTARFGISLCGKNDLLRRVQLLLNEKHYRKSKLFQSLSTFCVLIVAILSLSFILEPSYTPPDIEESSFELTPENAYFVINSTGEYDIYLDHQYIATMEQIDETLTNLPVYQSIEEVPYEIE